MLGLSLAAMGGGGGDAGLGLSGIMLLLSGDYTRFF